MRYNKINWNVISKKLKRLHIEQKNIIKLGHLNKDEKTILKNSISGKISGVIRYYHKEYLYNCILTTIKSFKKQYKGYMTKKGAEYLSKKIFDKSLGSIFINDFSTNPNIDEKLLPQIIYNFNLFYTNNQNFIKNIKSEFETFKSQLKSKNKSIKLSVQNI